MTANNLDVDINNNHTEESTEEKKMISQEVALATISKFLRKTWKSSAPSDLKITPLIGGYLNTIFIVENERIPETSLAEPRSVLIRLLGGGNFIPNKTEVVEAGFHMNSETEEALIYQEQSRTGNGPKIYGLFPNGRVEEFVKSHTLTHEEASRPEFLTDLGKVYARFHAMDLPLSRDYMRLLFGKVNINKELFYTPEMKETGIDFDFLLSIDFDHEMQMMKKVVDSVDSRDVLLQFDNHFLNVLTLEKSEGRNSQRDLRVMLIDYEISMYGKRFLDFGGHFNARMYNVANRNGSKASGHEFPPERERQLFLREYLKEYIRINGGDYNETIDNEEHLMLESETFF